MNEKYKNPEELEDKRFIIPAGQRTDATPTFGIMRTLTVESGTGTAWIGDDIVIDLLPGKVVSGVSTQCELRAGDAELIVAYTDED